ncbi:hypothetical protein BSZ19_24985 [Bradyrhizobium japonicum]|uniref:DUF3768 domain-containing protein n=1 Tax=Bradyrhizobium japonicum TaxID=375 RepID=A0A1Y2JKC5_BRAJP|nr:hypothetical protein BSZ19_24985 [Bradyrhizobium japonicum]
MRTDPLYFADRGCRSNDATRFFFKIDYYDRAGEFASPAPADPTVTRRVMTIMRADEY